MDLLCQPTSKIMAFGSFYFICAGISGSLLSSFAESSGRRKTILIAQAVAILAQFVLLFCPNYLIRLLASGILGLCQVKNGQTYAMAFELVNKRYKALLCSMINFWDFSFITIFNLYWSFVSKNWFYIQFFYMA